MKPLPQNSTGSVTGGIWFVFSHEGNTIRVWGSSLTGKERIYVEDQIVAEARNFKRHEKLEFSIGDKKYAVTFNVISMAKGQLECILSCNGASVDAFLAKWVPKPIGRSLLVLTLAWIATAAVLLTWLPQGPRRVSTVVFALVTVAALSSVKGGGISIERIPV